MSLQLGDYFYCIAEFMFENFRHIIFLIFLAPSLFWSSPVYSQSDLDLARSHLEAGELEKAIQLAGVLPANLALDAALIQVRAHIELGNYKLAKQFGQTAISISPKSFDARFLYALALERSGEQGLALVHFRRAIDFASNDSQRRFAANGVSRIGAAKSLNLSGSLGLAPSTNFNKATSNKEVDLVLGSAEITSADPIGDVGLTYSAEATISKFPSLAFALSGMAASSSTAQQFIGSLSYRTRTPSGSNVAAVYQSRWVGGDHHQNRLELTSTIPSRFVDSLSLGLDLVSFSDGSRVTAPRLSLSNELFRSDNLLINGEFRAKSYNSTKFEYAGNEVGLSLTSFFEIGKFDTQLAGSLNVRNWDAAYSLFPDARRDQDKIVSFVVAPKELSFWGLRPIARASFIDRASNIAIYDIQSQDFYFGYEARF